MSMCDCESNSANKGGPNVHELVMKGLKDRHREEGEQETDVL